MQVIHQSNNKYSGIKYERRFIYPAEMKVGSLYNPKTRRWPEGTQYNFADGIHSLTNFMHNIRPIEKQSMAKKPIKLAVTMIGDVIFFLYGLTYLTNIPEWGDAPYTWHLLPNKMKVAPSELNPDAPVHLRMNMVDAGNGIVRVSRLVELEPSFVKILHRAIEAQIKQPFNEADYDRQLAQVYARYSPADLYKQCIAECSVERARRPRKPKPNRRNK